MSHHHHSDYIDVVSAKAPAQLSGKMKGTFITMIVVGIIAFAISAFVMGDKSRIGWISFLHNLYYFTGVSAAGVVVASIVQVTRAMWGRPIKRYAEAMGAFLPFSIVGIIILWIGAHITDPQHFIYEWVVPGQPDPDRYHNKAWWLQTDFVFARQLVSLLILTFLSFKMRNLSLRPDLGLAHEKNPDNWAQPSGWRGLEEEVADAQTKMSFWGVVYCFAYAICISLFAYDMIMSMDFRWISTMFGGWSFTSCMLMAWGSLVLITWWMSDRFGVDHYMHKKLYHDLGKLTFGFTIVWGYLFFAQLNVIWYGNLAHETGYIITRVQYDPWKPLAWTAGVMVFLIPFILGLGKQRKMSPKTFAPVVFISLIGLWIERFVLIAPAGWYYDRKEEVFDGGIGTLMFFDVCVFVGFLGLWCLVFAKALYKNPIMVISDPRLDEGINRH